MKIYEFPAKDLTSNYLPVNRPCCVILKAGSGDDRPCSSRRWKAVSCSCLSFFSSRLYCCKRLLLTALLGWSSSQSLRAASYIFICSANSASTKVSSDSCNERGTEVCVLFKTKTVSHSVSAASAVPLLLEGSFVRPVWKQLRCVCESAAASVRAAEDNHLTADPSTPEHRRSQIKPVHKDTSNLTKSLFFWRQTEWNV